MKATFSPYRIQHYNGTAPKNLVEFFLNDHIWPRSQRKVIQRPGCDWKPINPDHELVAIESRVRLGDEKSFLFDSPAISLYSTEKEFPLLGNIDYEQSKFSAFLKGAFCLGALDVEVGLSISKDVHEERTTETKMVIKGVGVSGVYSVPESVTTYRQVVNNKASLNIVVGQKSFSGPPLTISAKLDSFSQYRFLVFGRPFLLGGSGQKSLLVDHSPTPIVTVDRLPCTSTGDLLDQASLFIRDQQAISSQEFKRAVPYDFFVDDAAFQVDFNNRFEISRLIAPKATHILYNGWREDAHPHRIIIGQTMIGYLPRFDGLVSFDFSGI